MIRLVAILVFFVAAVFPLRRAAAAEARLPVGPGVPAVAAGRPPSASHPEGTLVVLHPNVGGAPEAFEWDVARARVLARKTLGSPLGSASLVRVARAGGRLYAVFGADVGAEPVVLMRLTLDLVVEARREIGRGSMPSIDVDDAASTVVTAFFEARPPNAPPEGSVIVLAPPSKILHVQTREASSLQLVTSGFFLGADGALLSPHGMPWLAARAVALHDGRLVIALPLRGKTRLVTAGPTTLAIATERELSWPGEPFGSVALVRAAGGVVAFSAGRPVDALGAPSMSGAARRTLARGGHDAVVAWGAIHVIAMDDGGNAVLETRPAK